MHIDDASRALAEELLHRSCENLGCANCALWLANGDFLEPLLGHGPHAKEFIGKYSHPLSEGIISMVYASGRPFCENGITANPDHSSRLDEMLGVQTDAMIAMPVVCGGHITGVLTFVHTTPAGASDEPSAFSALDMAEAEFASALTGRILDSME